MSHLSFLRAIKRSDNRSFLKTSVKWIVLNLTIAIIYHMSAKLSVDFATLPNKISAVWLPSGLTTAWLAWFGIGRTVPGIFLGVMVGLVMDLPSLSGLSLLFLGVMITLGDSLQPIVIISAIRRIGPLSSLFNHVHSVTIFILMTLVGPALSATLGVTALAIVQTSTREQYGISWITWCLASTLANLLFTPLLLLWRQRSPLNVKSNWIERGILIGLILGLSGLMFGLNSPVEYMFLPLLIWSAFRSGSFFTTSLIALISMIAIPMTAKGIGPFTTRSVNESLLLLQSFIAICSVTNILLIAAIHERKVAELALERTMASLEQQVEIRTSELQESKSILDSFFASAPLGLGIINDDLQYVQVNHRLADFDGRSIVDHLGQTIQQVSPDWAASLIPMYEQVLLTGQPILNQEETRTTLDQPELPRTWLMSYFPIVTHDLISKVGFIVMEISDRKRLEQQLKRQARQDPLTSLSNRLHFKEVSESEWRRCQRSGQPFSIILMDIDYFKRYNDTYGHLAGDACLVQVASLLKTVGARSGDLVVRFGGEEFLVMLPGTDAIGAQHVADVIRQRLKDAQIPHSGSEVGADVTLSMGVVICVPDGTLQMDEVIQKADEALYESKRLGRDRMTIVTIES